MAAEKQEKRPYVFLDFDGVLTSCAETPGSYMTNRGPLYGASPSCFGRLRRLISETGAVVVISSNWRRFDETGPGAVWRNAVYGDVVNPLPGLKKALGGAYLCDLPATRHITKSEALRLWFGGCGIDLVGCRYVVFDDDSREGFAESEFAGHFVLTNYLTGLTDEDCRKAKEILKP